MAIIILALLHGGLDYSKSITTAVMCGIDTDCTSGTVGSIVGAAVGYAKLDKKWVLPFNDSVRTYVAAFGNGTVTELVNRTYAVWEKYKP